MHKKSRKWRKEKEEPSSHKEKKYKKKKYKNCQVLTKGNLIVSHLPP